MKFTLCVVGVMMILAGCTTAPVTTPPSPVPAPAPAPTPPPIPTASGWSYDAFVAQQLTPKLLAANGGVLCPHWSPALAQKFLLAMVRATAYFESGYKPATDYTESFPDSSGKRQVSSGLMQLSLDDKAKGTPYCKQLAPGTIHDPKINLGCALEIMNILVGTRSTMELSLGRYWSTIGSGKVLPNIKRDMPECFQ